MEVGKLEKTDGGNRSASQRHKDLKGRQSADSRQTKAPDFIANTSFVDAGNPPRNAHEDSSKIVRTYRNAVPGALQCQV